MLRDRYTFKRGYNEWGALCANLKEWLPGALSYHPKSLGHYHGLLNASVLKDFCLRLDRKLCQYKSTVTFTIKTSEALAVYVAYRLGALPRTDLIMEIVTAIDRQS